MAAKANSTFSWHLFKQDFKANWVLILVILIIMVMMQNVVNFATSMMESSRATAEVEESQEGFFEYLGVLAAYDTLTGSELSYADFAHGGDRDAYDRAFEMISARSEETEYTTAEFESLIQAMSSSDIDVETYVREFEYAFALSQQQGIFTGEDLSIEDMMKTTLAVMGVSETMVDSMGEMDMTYMLNRMYFTVIGLLPIFLLVVLLANSLIASQVDNGSMAYILSTPITRGAVARTHAVFMIMIPLIVVAIVCCTRFASNNLLHGDPMIQPTVTLYAGMYILVEALCGICYLGSCLFNSNGKSLAFGGGIAVWCFLASLLGVFGTENLINMGVGVEQLGLFNRLTLVGLYDIEGLSVAGTGDIATDALLKLGALAIIALACYIAGSVFFRKKDLPL